MAILFVIQILCQNLTEPPINNHPTSLSSLSRQFIAVAFPSQPGARPVSGCLAVEKQGEKSAVDFSASLFYTEDNKIEN